MKLSILALLLMPALAWGLPRDVVHPISTHLISSPFGNRNHPVLSGVRHHDGIDLPSPEGTPVRAMAAGTVIAVGSKSGYGRMVLVLHSDGWSTLYAHLKSWQSEIGQTVQSGQILGAVGSTGLVTGPHLHFELRKNGMPVNPLFYLPFLSAQARG